MEIAVKTQWNYRIICFSWGHFTFNFQFHNLSWGSIPLVLWRCLSVFRYDYIPKHLSSRLRTTNSVSATRVEDNSLILNCVLVPNLTMYDFINSRLWISIISMPYLIVSFMLLVQFVIHCLMRLMTLISSFTILSL